MKLMPLTVNFRDERGDITDLIEAEEINAVTLVTFCKGAIRGNHVHKHTVQYNYLLRGSIELVTQLADGQRQHRITLPRRRRSRSVASLLVIIFRCCRMPDCMTTGQTTFCCWPGTLPGKSWPISASTPRLAVK